MSDERLLERLRGVDAYTLADAGRRLGVGRVVDSLRPVTTATAFAGRALTARVEYDSARFIPLGDYGVGTLLDAVRAGDVLVLDGGGLPLTALGDLAMAVLARQGAAGAVVNARVRDIEAIDETRFPVFAIAAGITTLAGHARIVDIGAEVEIDGTPIATGDLVAGCKGGLVVAAWSCAAALADVAERILATDRAVMDGIRAGRALSDLWRAHKT